MRLYIAVKDNVPDHMVPVLVAHTVMNANDFFSSHLHLWTQTKFIEWKKKCFKKCVVKVNQKEWDNLFKMGIPLFCGYESTVNEGLDSCAIPLPVEDKDLPNVLKYAKMWKPDTGFSIAAYRGVHVEGDNLYYDEFPKELNDEQRRQIHLQPLYEKNK